MITANEVASAVGGLNKRARQPIPDALKRNPPLYIFNIYEMKHTRGLGSLGTFHVPACEPGEAYSKPLVVPGEFFDEFDRGEGSLGWTYETGADVAKAILNVGHRDGADLSAWGVFLAADKSLRGRSCQRRVRSLRPRCARYWLPEMHLPCREIAVLRRSRRCIVRRRII